MEKMPWKVLPANTKLKPVMTRIEIRSAPRTFSATSADTMMKPMMASTTPGLCRSPSVT